MPTRRRNQLFAALALLVSGCAAPDVAREEGTVSFALQATQRNAGQTGTAIMGAQDNQTALRYTVTGVPPWVARPVQLFTFVYAGTCAQHAEPPAFALNDIVQVGLFSNNSVAGPFTMSKVVPAPFASLRASPHALVVRTTAADGNVDIYCGEMR